MSTAEEILKRHLDYIDDNFSEKLKSAINEARVEAIKECAEVVTLCGRLYCEEEDFYGYGEIKMTNKRGMVDTVIKPDKQSILKLLDHLK